MKISDRDGENHVWKGESSNYLECLDSRWGVEKGDLGNGLEKVIRYCLVHGL